MSKLLRSIKHYQHIICYPETSLSKLSIPLVLTTETQTNQHEIHQNMLSSMMHVKFPMLKLKLKAKAKS